MYNVYVMYDVPTDVKHIKKKKNEKGNLLSAQWKEEKKRGKFNIGFCVNVTYNNNIYKMGYELN